MRGGGHENAWGGGAHMCVRGCWMLIIVWVKWEGAHVREGSLMLRVGEADPGEGKKGFHAVWCGKCESPNIRKSEQNP